MEDRFLVSLVAGLSLVVMCTADLQQTQYQFARPLQVKGQNRNFIPNRLAAKKVGHYPPVPPGTRQQLLPGFSRNFIPNRFDIPASVLDRKPGASAGCIGASPCGLVPPASPPALPMPPAYPAPVPYVGYPPQNPYNPQEFPVDPAMATNGYPNFLAQSTNAAVAAKAKLLGGIKPRKKFVPHLPPMGRRQPGKPPFNPPPPPPEPEAAAYGQAAPLPYQQPLSYGPQGMAPPQAPGFAPPAFTAPQAQIPFAPQQPQPAYSQAPPLMGAQQQDEPQLVPYNAPQVPPPMGAQQQDEPQLVPNNSPQVPPPQVSFSPEMNQGPAAFNDPGQQMPLDGSFDMAKKRMTALKVNRQAKRFGVPRPVLKSRLVPKALFKRHRYLMHYYKTY